MTPSPGTALQNAKPHARMGAWEKTAALLLLLLLVVARIGAIYSLSYSSDEPQHLHVAWGWTKGMVEYRDYFDNHTPLFHLSMAPLVRFLGERADILTWMRFAMLPFFVAALACIAWLGKRLYSGRVGVWAVLLSATCPIFLKTGTQFRTDVPWMTAWFATLAFALCGPFTRSRALITGLLLGATFGISMKTSLLLASLLGAWGMVLALSSKAERAALLKGSLANGLFALAGLCVIPGAIAGFFAMQDAAIPPLVYCVFKHNTIHVTIGGIRRYLPFLFPLLLLLTAWSGRQLLRAGAGSEPDRALAVRRTLLFFTSALFFLLLICFWPMLTSQDYLPGIPLLALTLVPLLLRYEKAGKWILVLAVGLQMHSLSEFFSFSTHRTADSQALVADILRLTRPSDFVMDAKGETIFRRRPYYYVLENITLCRLNNGSIRDTIVEDMIKTRTCVSVLRRLPDPTELWVRQHFVRVTEKIFVTGCILPAAAPAVSRHFEVSIPAKYVVRSASGSVEGTLDGLPYSGPVLLAPGPHTFTCNDSRALAVFWAQAAENGFIPCDLRL